MKRQIGDAGAVAVIDLGDGTKAMARMLDPPLWEFYDLFLADSDDVDLAGLLDIDVLSDCG